ncbi:hypothetical protein RN001_004667 [Aquatica leii]|uniref:Uncharacterized protein n=1 Tax=Aquatica leii TaxID=1421715 RepID=A0AAN7PBX7_9COLE|nr:hypothetical protein RN001_004667 [Aquatica leii]
MEEILQQITALRQDNLEIKNELKTLKEKYESNEKKWQLEKNVLETRIKQLEDDKEREEKRKKKNNIIISGIKTNEENVEETVKNFFLEELNVEPAIEKPILIGKQKNKKLILIKFLNFTEKLNIMKKKKTIQDRQVFINNDLTVQERKIQKVIRDIAKEEKNKGKVVKVLYNKIIINNDVYVWNKKTEAVELKN